MNNSLGIKRFGPITFYVKHAQVEAERLAATLGMTIAYVPAGPEQIFGLEANDVLFILDGSPRASALAERYGNYISEIGPASGQQSSGARGSSEAYE